MSEQAGRWHAMWVAQRGGDQASGELQCCVGGKAWWSTVGREGGEVGRRLVGVGEGELEAQGLGRRG